MENTMTQEIKNDNITVVVENKPGCHVLLNITVAPKASQEAHKKAIKSVSKEVSLPGFRKGKAPEPLIIKHYASYVNDEWRQNILQTAFSEAMKLTKMYPLNDNSVKKPTLKNASLDQDSVVVIEFESHPNLPQVDTQNFEITKIEPKPVTEEAVKEFLNELRWHFAEWEEIKDRPVQEDDSVILDIENLDKPGHFVCKDTTFNVIKGKMGNWMHKKIIGLNVGDSFEATSEQTEHEKTETEFVPTQCKVTVKEIKKANLPEIDDKLAASMGAENVEDLTKKAKENLEKQATESARDHSRMHIEKNLLEKYPFELPGTLVQAEIKNRTAIRRIELAKMGLSSTEANEALEKEQESIIREVDKVLRTFFLVRKIGEDNNIDVSQNELLEGLMQEMYSSQNPIDFSKDAGEARSRVYVRLMTQKVMDFLVENSKTV
jgi:trigger factor